MKRHNGLISAIPADDHHSSIFEYPDSVAE